MKTSATDATLHLRAMALFDEYLDLRRFRRTHWLARLRRDERHSLPLLQLHFERRMLWAHGSFGATASRSQTSVGTSIGIDL